jgi:aryl-alcohol dehydrogenase-like predicted oxidoreductase
MKTVIKRRPSAEPAVRIRGGLRRDEPAQAQTREQAYEILNYVLDQGVNLIDTARSYNGPNGSGEMIVSEQMVGETIAARTDIDEPIVVVTKGHGYTVEAFDKDLNTSLKRWASKRTSTAFHRQVPVRLCFSSTASRRIAGNP